MIKEFSVELTQEDAGAVMRAAALAPRGATVRPDITPGRKTFTFDENALVTVSNGDFERFMWSAFDRVDQHDGIITLAKGSDVVFYLPVVKLQDPDIRRAIWDFVSGRVGLQS